MDDLTSEFNGARYTHTSTEVARQTLILGPDLAIAGAGIRLQTDPIDDLNAPATVIDKGSSGKRVGDIGAF